MAILCSLRCALRTPGSQRSKTHCSPTLGNYSFPDPLRQFWPSQSRWPELHWRPTPSLTPHLFLYMRTRLYLCARGAPLSVVRARHKSATVSSRCLADFDRYSGFTVMLPLGWAETKASTMGLLYYLSYIGILNFQLL